MINLPVREKQKWKQVEEGKKNDRRWEGKDKGKGKKIRKDKKC